MTMTTTSEPVRPAGACARSRLSSARWRRWRPAAGERRRQHGPAAADASRASCPRTLAAAPHAGAAADLPRLPRGPQHLRARSTAPTGARWRPSATRARRGACSARRSRPTTTSPPIRPSTRVRSCRADIARIVAEVKPPAPEQPLPDGRRLPGARQEAVRVCAEARHRAGVQAQVRHRGAQGRPQQGPGGARLRPGDGRAGHLRHAVRHQPGDQAGQADLLGARLCPAAARQLDGRAGQARRGLRQAPHRPWPRRPARRRRAPPS